MSDIIVPATLSYFGQQLRESALPPLADIETRGRHDVQARLERATSDCPNRYTKGQRSFELLGKLNPDTLEQLPSFKRARRILEANL